MIGSIVIYWAIAVLFGLFVALMVYGFVDESLKVTISAFVFTLVAFWVGYVALTPVTKKSDEPVTHQYYSMGYKAMDFVEDGMNKIAFVTEKGAYIYNNTSNLDYEDYENFLLKMDDNGTPDDYTDDEIWLIFSQARG